MSFVITPELQALKDSVRQFVDEVLEPNVPRLEAEGRIPDAVVQELKRRGYFGFAIPKEYGGQGLGAFAYGLVNEEISRTHSAYGTLTAGNNGIGSRGIVNDGTKEQKELYLPSLARGDMIAALALTEPGAGSDASGITTAAEKVGNNYVINGVKHFISRGSIADVAMVMAVTDSRLRERGGITAILVEKGTPGFRVGQKFETMGEDIVPVAELIFENCTVPASNVVGEVGYGFSVAMKTLDSGRLNIAAKSIGAAQRVMEYGIDHLKKQFPHKADLLRQQAATFMLSDCAIEIHAARLMLYEATWQKDQGGKVSQQASMVKVYATEMLGRVIDRAIQVLGPESLRKGHPVQRIYRDARLNRIVEGTSEIQRLIISRHLFR